MYITEIQTSFEYSKVPQNITSQQLISFSFKIRLFIQSEVTSSYPSCNMTINENGEHKDNDYLKHITKTFFQFSALQHRLNVTYLSLIHI